MAGTTSSPVGELLREWRALRGQSQLDLALAAEVSSRHVSFLETGRSRPSRKMVLRLAEALELPLRERNALLVAAGFAALYGESSLGDGELAPVRRALEILLQRHEPYPAFVVDRTWNVLLANAAHRWLLSRLLPQLDPAEPVNVMQLVLDPGLLRPRIRNWSEVAHVLGHRIRRQLRLPEPNAEARTRLESFLKQPGVHDAMAKVRTSPQSEVVLPLILEVDGEALSWFSTIATIGTPRDVTLEELSIESLFPADENTRRWVDAQLPQETSIRSAREETAT
ncbi:MAG: helix-turn-helix transcriptional regulator [Planctomycetota bacterium]|nr:helix-turn-helix transcriptional regulator [Planctomycetota bacterium]